MFGMSLPGGYISSLRKNKRKQILIRAAFPLSFSSGRLILNHISLLQNTSLLGNTDKIKESRICKTNERQMIPKSYRRWLTDKSMSWVPENIIMLVSLGISSA